MELETTVRALLTGGNGMLARSIASAWRDQRDSEDLVVVTRTEADLTNAAETRAMVARIQPDIILHCAARVGGIAANIADPTTFLMDNLLIDSSILKAAVDLGVPKLLYFGSSCMYPRDYRQPLVETDLLAAPLEPTNEGYALSKIVASKYCEYVSTQFGLDYRVVIPSNLYGPDDDYSLGQGHLVAAAIAKVHAAKESGASTIGVWGDGTARREFTYVGDLADWIVTNVDDIHSWPTMMNVGFGSDHSVLEYYQAAMTVVGYTGELELDTTKPAGMHQKLMTSAVAHQFGWQPHTELLEGMDRAYRRYLETLS
ncbi:NAD-dependent epimerase/dehydratase family protein [Cryobacterium sp. HLT2-28]|uniref:NAD-dependent epimerase/dehydratase family protein n=1 Tax=Cryobacterium sp. HLT2-28 TaxID=1259146 RepID=UPI00106C8F8A|nr:NAD-dependent epimerase/dehydratase family protein [Cryobacterium sp. HLT2-28]TFB91040.1 NAD-dependent epimerase/dehydratase family protein [Cryobacterium sp. HLT2-28]